MKALSLFSKLALLISFLISFSNIAMAEEAPTSFIPQPSNGICPSDYPIMGTQMNPGDIKPINVCFKALTLPAAEAVPALAAPAPTPVVTVPVPAAAAPAPVATVPAPTVPAPAILAPVAKSEIVVAKSKSSLKRFELGFTVPGADPQGAGLMANWVPCGTVFSHKVCGVLGATLGGQFGVQAGLRVPVKRINNVLTLDIEALLRLGVHFRPITADHVVIPLTGEANVGLNIAPAALDGQFLRVALGLGVGSDLNANGSISDAIGVTPGISLVYNFDETGLAPLRRVLNKASTALAPRVE